MRYFFWFVCVLLVGKGASLDDCANFGCAIPGNGVCLMCMEHCYGRNCEHSCGRECNTSNSKTCNRIGHCYQCKPGYYGSTCDQVCPSGCAKSTCDKITGVCDTHCRTGFHGAMCNKACPDHCKNGTCNQETGGCHIGCVTPYSGYFCKVTSTGTPNKQQLSCASRPSYVGLLTIICIIYSVFTCDKERKIQSPYMCRD